MMTRNTSSSESKVTRNTSSSESKVTSKVTRVTRSSKFKVPQEVQECIKNLNELIRLKKYFDVFSEIDYPTSRIEFLNNLFMGLYDMIAGSIVCNDNDFNKCIDVYAVDKEGKYYLCHDDVIDNVILSAAQIKEDEDYLNALSEDYNFHIITSIGGDDVNGACWVSVSKRE